MSYIFFVSSAGDTDLAKATIRELQDDAKNIHVVPLTSMSEQRLGDLPDKNMTITPISKIFNKPNVTQLGPDDAKSLDAYLKAHKLNIAYMGVPSPVSQTLAYDVAKKLTIPCVVANEFMFNDPAHPFWSEVNSLNENDCEFALPLGGAMKAIRSKVASARVHQIGHLSIDKALGAKSLPAEDVCTSLGVSSDKDFIFVSGTTQPIDVDKAFVEALLKALSSKRYPLVSLRFGIHPGVNNLDAYLECMLTLCEKYDVSDQFTIVLPSHLEQKLEAKGIHSKYLLRVDVSGPQMASAAAKVAQAVPGGLLNEGLIKGKPAYYHKKSVEPYLPGFTGRLVSFLKATSRAPKTYKALGLEQTAPKEMADVLRKKLPCL